MASSTTPNCAVQIDQNAAPDHTHTGTRPLCTLSVRALGGKLCAYAKSRALCSLPSLGLTDGNPLSPTFSPRCSDQVLDKWGDTTDQTERVAYFAQIDNDDSEGVDFEEFLEVCAHEC